MEGKNESKHTPEKSKALNFVMKHIELPFQAEYDTTNKQWNVYTLTGNLVCTMARRAKLIIESGEVVDQELIYRDLILSAPTLQAEVDRLTKEKSELVSVLTDFTAWCEYPDVSKVLGMSQATIFHTAKDLLTRIK